MRTVAGMTLIELLTVLGVAVVTVTAATPAIRNLLLDARMTGAVNSLVHAVHLARQEAQRDLRDVVVCPSSDGALCEPPGSWTRGWIVFINENGDDPPRVDAGDTVLHATQQQALLSITSNRGAYVLRPYALRATNGTVVFCDERGGPYARAVIISYTGRPRVAARAANGQPLSCPG